MFKMLKRNGHNINRLGYKGGANGILSEYDVIREYSPFIDEGLKNTDVKIINVTPKPGTYKTPKGDVFGGIQAANEIGGDIFVSLHANAYKRSDANGCGVFYYPGSVEGQKLAKCIQKYMVRLGFKDRGVKSKKFWELEHTTMAAVIIEPFFVTNPTDCKRYDPEKLGTAIANGINEYIEEHQKNHKTLQRRRYIAQFQDYYNFTTETKNPLEVNGVYDERTKEAFELIGSLLDGRYKF